MEIEEFEKEADKLIKELDEIWDKDELSNYLRGN